MLLFFVILLVTPVAVSSSAFKRTGGEHPTRIGYQPLHPVTPHSPTDGQLYRPAATIPCNAQEERLLAVVITTSIPSSHAGRPPIPVTITKEMALPAEVAAAFEDIQRLRRECQLRKGMAIDENLLNDLSLKKILTGDSPALIVQLLEDRARLITLALKKQDDRTIEIRLSQLKTARLSSDQLEELKQAEEERNLAMLERLHREVFQPLKSCLRSPLVSPTTPQGTQTPSDSGVESTPAGTPSTPTKHVRFRSCEDGDEFRRLFEEQ